MSYLARFSVLVCGRGELIHGDSELVRRALRREPDAFAGLAQRYARSVHALAYARLLSHADAEDVTQDAFLRAYEKLGQLREPDRFEGWLHRIALACARDLLRRRAREIPTDVEEMLRDVPSSGATPEEAAERGDLRSLAPRALGTLPESLRAPLVMRCMDNASYGAIARRLHISPNAAAQRVARARTRLREYLRRSMPSRDCDDLMRALYVVPPFATHAVLELCDQMGRDPTQQGDGGRSGAGRVTYATVGGAVGILGVLCAIWVSFGAFDGKSTDESMPRRAEATTRDAVAVELMASTPAVRLLLSPGTTLDGWAPAIPSRDASLPTAVRDDAGAGGLRARVANAFGVYRPLAPATGEITLSARVLPANQDAGTDIGFMLDGGTEAGEPISLLRKDYRGQWMTSASASGDARRVYPVAARPLRVKLVYRAWRAGYDVYIEDRPFALDVQHDPRFAGRAVTGVYLRSGQGGVASPTYFDSIRVQARDVAGRLSLPSATPAERPPSSTIAVTATDVPGLDLADAAPAIRVAPGGEIAGTVDIEVFNAHGSNTEFPVIVTPTWGEHSTSWREVARSVRPGFTEHRARLSLVAPSRPGVYHVVFVGAPETTAEQVASGTHWRIGAAVWNNQADVAAWSASPMNAAARGETIQPPWLCAGAAGNPPAIRSALGPAAIAITVSVVGEQTVTASAR